MKIVLFGYVVRFPLAGLALHHLQYALGLERMGHEVTFVETAGWPQSCYDPSAGTMGDDPAYGVRYLRTLLDRFGIRARWCYLDAAGEAHGLSSADLAAACKAADLLINLDNVNDLADVPGGADVRRKALVDADPVFTQLGGFGLAAGDDPFAAYDTLFTHGLLAGSARTEMPDDGNTWHPTRQPVVADIWPVSPVPTDAPVTSVMSWSAYKEIEHAGKIYGQRDRTFAPFFDLPQRIDTNMLLALKGPDNVAAKMKQGGWQLCDPSAVTQDVDSYLKFIAESAAEFSVVKHAYAAARSGNFSDRTCAYMACGRPAVVQDTGFSDLIPTGEGLFAFTTPEEAEAGLQAVTSAPQRHGDAARRVVEEHFNATKVLQDLLDKTG